MNTNTTVDHDTRIGDGVHVMPGATVAGEVVIENEAVIGTNATILPRLRVGTGAVVGAGAVVTHDIEAGMTVVGVQQGQLQQQQTVVLRTGIRGSAPRKEHHE